MTWAWYVNDVDLASLGVYCEGLPGRFGAPARSFAEMTIPGRDGAILISEPETGARVLRVQGSVVPAGWTLADRVEAEHRVKELLFRGLVKLVADDDVTAPQQIDGVCTDCEFEPVVHPAVSLSSRFTATLRCPDPCWRDVVAQMIAFNATAVAVPTGTATAGGILRCMAPVWSANVVDPLFTLRNAASVAVASIGFGITLTAGTDYLEVDLDRSTAVKVSSGVRSNAIANLEVGDFFAIDPMDGARAFGSYGTLEVTAASGTPSGVYLGARRWL